MVQPWRTVSLFTIIVLSGWVFGLLAALPLPGQAGQPPEEPWIVLTHYLHALYTRDSHRAYMLISSQDRQWKSQEEYLRENPPWEGPARELAQKLATLITYQERHTEIHGDRATVTLAFRIPNANAPAVRRLVRDFDAERLARLSPPEREAIKTRLDALYRAERLPMIAGEDTWELVKEPAGWRVFLNWAGAIRVQFVAAVKEHLPWRFWPVQKEVLALPGETLHAVYRVKNLSDHPVTAKAIHRIAPQDQAQYLEIIQCFCFLQTTLEPGEEKELPLTFRVRWDAPETVTHFTIRYAFYPIEAFPGPEPDREAQQLGALEFGWLEVRVQDHREAITDFRRLVLSISQINIQRGTRPKAGAWLGLAPTVQDVDLTRLVDGRYAVILHQQVPVGTYRWLKLHLESVHGVLNSGKPVRITVQDAPVARTFQITPGETTVLTVDFVLLDVREHGGQYPYALHIRNVSVQRIETTGSSPLREEGR
ncbi:MAG: DUF4382 domain-containing protein [Nitrospinota bacterium]|nr:MAG: DUF4382 domain-containing protein [Nitrospinota bacterium]